MVYYIERENFIFIEGVLARVIAETNRRKTLISDHFLRRVLEQGLNITPKRSYRISLLIGRSIFHTRAKAVSGSRNSPDIRIGYRDLSRFNLRVRDLPLEWEMQTDEVVEPED